MTDGLRRRAGLAPLLVLSALIASDATAAPVAIRAPSGPLADALIAFGRHTGLTISFRPELAAGRRTGGFVGAAEPSEALARILGGTGLNWRFVDATTVELLDLAPMQDVRVIDEGATPLEEISVAGGVEGPWGPVDGIVATQSATGSKIGAPILETPQTVNVVTADEISQRGVRNIDEALRYTPGVFTQYEGGSEGRRDTIFSRGFVAQQFLDGLPVAGGNYGFGVTRIEPYGLERVEILKGPGSTVFGRNSPGGAVNMVSKRPTVDPVREAEVQFGSGERIQGAFDFSGPVNEGGGALFRIVGLGRNAEGELKEQRDDRIFLAPSLTVKPGDATTITLNGQFQKDETGIGQLAPVEIGYLGLVKDVDDNRFWGNPNWDGYDRTQWMIGYEAEHRFGDDLRIKQNLRYGETRDEMRFTSPWGLLPDLRTLERYEQHYKSTSKIFAVDNQAIGKFETGPLRHEVLVGLDYSRQYLSDRGALALPESAGGDVPPIDIYDPRLGASGRIGPLGPAVTQVQHQTGLYAEDRIFLDRWIATLGLRHDWVRTEANADNPAQTPSRFSGRAGLSYVFDNGIAPYVSYSTSFSPEVGLAADTGKPFQPSLGEQYEAGVKFQPKNFNGFFTVAAFDITRTNVLTPYNGPDPDIFGDVQTGEARVKGFEIEGKTTPVPGLDLIASYSLIDSEVTKSTAEAAVGTPLHAAPKHQAAFWAAYEFQPGSALQGLGVGGGVRYTSKYYSDVGRQYPIASMTLFDARVSYDFGALNPSLKGLSLAVNGLNILDKEYFVAANPYTAAYGQGRTIYATARYKW